MIETGQELLHYRLIEKIGEGTSSAKLVCSQASATPVSRGSTRLRRTKRDFEIPRWSHPGQGPINSNM
jgi:hypothetical protein